MLYGILWWNLEEFFTQMMYFFSLIVALWMIMGLSQLLQLLPTKLTLIINPPCLQTCLFHWLFNNLTHKGVGTILSVCDMMSFLGLSGNLHFPSSSGFTALKLLTEALSSGTASKPHSLHIDDWQLTSRHAYYLLLLITQARNLQKLTIGENELQECVPLLVSAAKYLTELDITATGNGDKELLKVGLILQSNTNMRELSITSSPIFADAMDSIRIETVSRFIEIIISPDSQSCLEQLLIADCYILRNSKM